METLLETPESDDFFIKNSTTSLYVSQDEFIVPTNLLILLSILYGGISFLAVIGNCLVIWIIFTSKQMHSVTNFFIGNLALSDVIIGLFSIPFQFQAAVLQRWDLPEFMCPFCPLIQVLSVNVSIFTLTAIAIDRHKAIVNPLSARLSKNSYKFVIAVIWTVSLVLAIPISYALRVVQVTDYRLIGGFNNTGTNESEVYSNFTKPFCANVNMSEEEQLAYRYTLVVVQYFIPVIIISFVYIQMAVKLWFTKAPGNAQSERDITLLKNKKKVIKMLVIVVVSFCIAWLPLQTYNALSVTWPSINEYKHIQIIFLCCDWLAMSNSCYNPFIYGIYNEKFKREFYKRFTILQKFGYGKRFTQSAHHGLATGATTLSEFQHEKTGSTHIYKTHFTKDRNNFSQLKKSCCVQNETMLSSTNNKTASSHFKSSHTVCNNDNIELHPFIDKNEKPHSENNEPFDTT